MLTVLLQQVAADQPQQSGWMSMLMIVLIFVVFYFFMIRPQSKRQKEIRKFQDQLESGNKVITSGGIYGKVKDVKENIVVIEVADNVRINVAKSMVFASPEDAPTQTQEPQK
mgnify:CR=1 FL=1